jgi:hypothetical protein
MKKIIAAFGFLMLLISCSGDNSTVSNPLNTEGTVLTKASLVDLDNNFSHTQDYMLAPGLLKITHSDGYIYNNIYNGNQIVQTDIYKPDTTLLSKIFNEYDSSGRQTVSKTLSYSNNQGYKVTITYDAEGNAEMHSFEGDFTNQNTPYGQAVKLYFENGEIVKKEVTGFSDGHTTTFYFTYDDKNCWHKNFPGYYQSQMVTASYYQSMLLENTHNLLRITESENGGTETEIYRYEYTYNSLNYPTTRNVFIDGVARHQLTSFYYQ